MTEPSTNPYASPNTVFAEATAPRSMHPLIPLWVWLAISVVTSFFWAPPADPTSMLIALAFGLLSFCAGAISGSSLHITLRALPLIPFAAIIVWLVLAPVGRYFALSAACYGVLSIAFGLWACRTIDNGRLRILSCFCAGYIVGSLLGVLGTVVGAGLGALLAKRSLLTHTAPNGG